MVTEPQVKQLSRRCMWTKVAALLAGTMAIFVYLGLAMWLRDAVIELVHDRLGSRVDFLGAIAVGLPPVVLFLTPMMVVQRKLKQCAIVCPNCSSDLSHSIRELLASKCCHYCGQQVIEGERASPTDAQPARERRLKRFLTCWFWAWPALGCGALVCFWFSPTLLQGCSHFLFVPGLIGVTTTGWHLVRTLDTRYVAQLIASSVALAAGVCVFW